MHFFLLLFGFWHDYPKIVSGGPPKSAYKPGISSTTSAKGRHSSSPLPSSPEQSGPIPSPLRAVSVSKNHASSEDVIPAQLTSKDKATAGTDREIPTKKTSVWENKGNGANSMDLQSMLITLLKENPKGMSVKVGIKTLIILDLVANG